MIDNGQKYKDEISASLLDVWYNPKYKFYNGLYNRIFEMSDNDWDNRYFVSLDKNGKVIGLISYGVERDINSASNFGAINFSELPSDRITFGVDLAHVINDIFFVFKHKKLKFSVLQGNPIEKSYDKFIKKYDGRIVGVLTDDIKLMDGSLYNQKLYEVLRDNFINKVNEKRKGLN